MRNKFLDYLKGVLIALVVLGHSIQYLYFHDQDFWSNIWFKIIYMFHMPLFMTVSGYVVGMGSSSNEVWRIFFFKKILSYLLPIFSWSLIGSLILLLAGYVEGGVFFLKFFIKDFFQSQWFLWALIGSNVILYISNCLRSWEYLILGCIFLLILLMPDYGNLYLFKYVFPFFIIGCQLARVGICRDNNILLLIFLISVIFLVYFFDVWNKETYIYVSKMHVDSENLVNIIMRWIFGLCASFAACFVIYYMYLFSPAWFVVLIGKIGKKSICIYIVSGLFFSMFMRFNWAASIGEIDAIGVGVWSVAILVASLAMGWTLLRDRTLGFLLFGR